MMFGQIMSDTCVLNCEFMIGNPRDKEVELTL